MPQCIPSLDKLRCITKSLSCMLVVNLTSLFLFKNLMDKLRIVDLRLLTYKKKLAFWINTYNACIIIVEIFLIFSCISSLWTAFNDGKLLALMNKIPATSCSHCVTTRTNLRSVAITDKGVYCRNVMNELQNAKTEYLHASIEVTIKKRTIWNRCWSGYASIEVTIKKRVVLPKLLYWYMQNFADDLESVLEWIYSQLPRTTSLRKSIMDCLKGESKMADPESGRVAVRSNKTKLFMLKKCERLKTAVESLDLRANKTTFE
ncbi:hypothetical protein EJ110_NYTH19211 [Nymphaea thermarum]|nr:hypothetical protein EJ110_NYTH19211 [Nymphaea thermarum]